MIDLHVAAEQRQLAIGHHGSPWAPAVAAAGATGTGRAVTRAVALVGPAGTGKTSLAEALLFASGAINRQGSIEAGSTVGDASPEARAKAEGIVK